MLRKIFASKDGKTVTGNFTALLFIQAANIILPLLVLPFLVRTLGVEKYGLIMFAQAFCVIAYVFVEFGFNLSATRRISIAKDDTEKRAQLFSAVYAVKGILLGAVAVIFIAIVFLFARFSIAWEVYLLSFGVVIGQAVFPEWFFQGIEKMRFIAIINVLIKGIFTALIFVFIRSEADFLNVPLFNAIGYIAGGMLSLIIALRYTYFKKPSVTLMRDLVKESSTLFVSNVAARLFNSANIFIVGLVLGDAMAGIFGSLEKILVALKIGFTPLYQAIFPWLSKQSPALQRKTINKMIPAICVLGVLAVLGIYILGDFILNMLYDNAEINTYSTLFKWFALTVLGAGLNMLFISLYFPAAGYFKTRMYILVVGGLINVALGFVLVHFYGLSGMIITVISTEFLLLILAALFYNKNKPKYLVEA